jgi:hypothetical protein
VDLTDLLLAYLCLGLSLASVEIVGLLRHLGGRLRRRFRAAVWVSALFLNFAETVILWPLFLPAIATAYWRRRPTRL